MADIYDLTDTWNDVGTTFDAIKMNVTDTASGSNSALVRLQVDGVDRFVMRKDGGLAFGSDGDSYLKGATADGRTLDWTRDGTLIARLGSTCAFASLLAIGPNAAIPDVFITRVGANVAGVRGGAGGSAGGALNFLEQTAPSAPAANQVVLYAEDDGAGKTRLMALFPTGAAQQVAIEP